MAEHSPVPAAKKSEAMLTFPEAIKAIVEGKKVRRKEWEDAEEFCLMHNSFLMIHVKNAFHAWTVSEGDMLAIDWVII